MLKTIPRWVRTAKHLQWPQIVGQVRVRGERWLERPEAAAHREATMFPGIQWACRGAFLPTTPPGSAGHDPDAGRFVFLNRERQLGHPVDWSASSMPALWQYHLHYFDGLWDQGYASSRRLVLDWIQHHPLGRNRIGWDSYPISLRLMNWCAYFCGTERVRWELDDAFRDAMWGSCWRQARWLSAHVETHLMGNHLLENGMALAFVGGCFGGADAEAWLEAGLVILRQQLPLQILSDGVHEERSPLYQLRIAQGLTALANVGDERIDAVVGQPLESMLDALDQLRHPDGDLALFNDGTLRGSVSSGALMEHVGAKTSSKAHFGLEASGYYGARCDVGHAIICDAGEIGPDHQPGHAHGDMLSFELSLFGKRFAVNAGTYDYDCSTMRAYCRSTMAQNTVGIEGLDQCEFWKSFRVGRRGRPTVRQWLSSPTGFVLEAEHDGYAHLPGGPMHRRRFVWSDEGILMIRDDIVSSLDVSATGRIHLHPDCRVEHMADAHAIVSHAGRRVMVAFAGDGHLDLEEGWYCPAFGVRHRNAVLCHRRARTAVGAFGLCIAPLDGFESFDLSSGLATNGNVLGWSA